VVFEKAKRGKKCRMVHYFQHFRAGETAVSIVFIENLRDLMSKQVRFTSLSVKKLSVFTELKLWVKFRASSGV
jgi:hypothetical protein